MTPTQITEQGAEQINTGIPAPAPGLLGTEKWGTSIIMGVLAGMLYGGSKEAAASISKDAEIVLKLGSTPDKREQYQLMRDAMEKRFIQVTRGSIVGGVRLGMFTATFYGLHNLLAVMREVHDVFNVAGAGSATAAMFGLICRMPLNHCSRGYLTDQSKLSFTNAASENRIGQYPVWILSISTRFGKVACEECFAWFCTWSGNLFSYWLGTYEAYREGK